MHMQDLMPLVEPITIKLPNKNPFVHGLAFEMYLPLNVDEMNRATKLLLDHNDFQCFSKSHTDVKTYYCDISEAYWNVENGF